MNPNECGFLGAIKIALSFDLYPVQQYLPRNFVRPVFRSRVEIQFGDLSWADEGVVMVTTEDFGGLQVGARDCEQQQPWTQGWQAAHTDPAF